MTKPPLTKLSVSIINYRTGALTLGCIRSVLDGFAELGDNAEGHIVVVDNASGDGSADEIAAWIADQPAPLPVTLVRSATNSGFSGGHNQGIGAREADFYLVLNSDAVLKPGFFPALLAAADAAPKIGLFAPRIDYQDGGTQTNCFRFHGALSELERAAETGPISRMLASKNVSLPMPPDPGSIEWASFACILLRHEMVAEIGPMDEGYFLYFEDAEYCLRARRAGWRIAYVPEALAIHFRGGSGPVKALAAARKRMPPYFYASRTRFLRQAHGRAGPILANLSWHLGRTIARTRALLGKPVPPAVEREGRDIWINVAAPLTGPRGG